jgi:predicted nucleic acid-binding Zn finger protein
MAATQFEIKVPGSNGAEYTIKRARNGASWYCSCPAWKFQHKAPADRSCKHIRALAGQLSAQAAR